MASLVSPLVSGIASAPSGRVEFYTSGTSVLSTSVFSDANGTVAATTHVLNSEGAIVRYVEEIVDVVVKDATGAIKRQFTWIDDARLVRTENAAFTGATDGGSTQTGGRTTVDAAWTSFQQSLGTTDAYVNINGSSQLIKNAIASGSGVFYNVKTGYGASGNGVADDASAIQQAINAAGTAGGGIVFFPPGNYKIGSALSIPSTAGVSLLGCSSSNSTTNASIITVSANGLVAGLVAKSSFISITGILFQTSSSAITSPLLAVNGNGRQVQVQGCSFYGGAATCITVVGAFAFNTQAANFISCYFQLRSTSGTFTDTQASGCPDATFQSCIFDNNGTIPTSSAFPDGWLLFNACRMFITNTTGGATMFGSTSNASAIYEISGCDIGIGCSSGTNALFKSTTNTATLLGSRISAGGAGTMKMFGTDTSSLNSVEAACVYSTTTVFGLYGFKYSSTWQARFTTQNVATTTATPNFDFSTNEVLHTAGASMQFQTPTNIVFPVAGTVFTIYYKNNTGGAITPTWVSIYQGVPATSVANGSTAVYEFRYSTNLVHLVAITASPVVSAT